MSRSKVIAEESNKTAMLFAWLLAHQELVETSQGHITIESRVEPVSSWDSSASPVTKTKMSIQLSDLSSDRVRQEMANWARALGKTEKAVANYGPDDEGGYFFLRGEIADCKVELWSYRSKVCTKKVVGTRTVKKQIPVTFETKEVQEDVVEWDCGDPLLKGVEA